MNLKFPSFRNVSRLIGLLIFTTFAVFNSCKKEDFQTGSFNLEFSADTILFDTVFTTIGSATEVFIVYNRTDNPVRISTIRIAGGSNSNFRLNVDGVPGKSFSGVEIGANDSMFIFAEVTVDPNNLSTPLVITDSILFAADNYQAYINLVAWGQNAHFHRPPTGSHIYPFFFADTVNQNIVWDNDLPHVVYGYAMIDSGQTLTINEGTNVYFHPGSGLIALSSGTLIVNGTQQNNVTFQGDRLGEDYKDIPGQWDRIWLSNLNLRSGNISPGSKNSSIKYAVIKNGTIGLQVDTAFDTDTTHLTLDLQNTIIKNMASYGVALRGSRVNAFNTVFANCGAQTAAILYGGKYNFYHCTFANFWNNGQRQDPAVSLNNYFGNTLRSLDAYFGNCIIYGNNENELGLDSFPYGNQFGFRFDHVLLKVENTFPTSDPLRYMNVLKATGTTLNPNFRDPDNNFYKPDSLNSSAIDNGSINITNLFPVLSNDITGTPRGSTVDLGAYEHE